MNQTTPAIIVGGFLGAGKTTFILRSLLPRFKNKNLGIIVNDYGEVNYDKILLYQEGMKVYGIEGGCFCCELGGEFLNVLAKLKGEVDFLLIETSGLSDPWPVYYSLESSGYRVELVVGVFGLDMDKSFLHSPLVKAQIAASHCFVLTKSDLVAQDEVKEKLKLFLSQQKPVFLASEGYIQGDIECLFGQIKPNLSFKTLHKTLSSYTLKLKGFYSKLELEKFLGSLPRDVYRVKGVVHCVESPMPLGLNYSFGNLFWERLKTKEEPFLVFIGKRIGKKLFKDFPKGSALSIEHEKVCFPLGEFDAREGIAYYKGKAIDELYVAEKLLEELEGKEYLLISGEGISFKDFFQIEEVLEKCKNSTSKRIVFWKVPSAVVSYILENLTEDFLVYHLSQHFLLPKAYLSLRVDTEEKERALFSVLKP